MAAHNKTPGPLEQLQLQFNDVLVQTGKALKAARRDGKGNASQSNPNISTRIPQCIEIFNCALDDMEGEIIKAKSTILRDLQLLQAKKNPPPAQIPVPERPPPPMESKPVAPPAPMVIDLDPSPQATPVQAHAAPPQGLTNPQPQVKQEAKPSAPVAPFPNMGFDLTGSPEVTSTPIPAAAPTPPITKMPTPTPAKMPTPTPAKMPTPIPAKASTPVMRNKTVTTTPARPGTAGTTAPTAPSTTTASILPTAQAAAAASVASTLPTIPRPASTPPKKETKVPTPASAPALQLPRSAAATPQAPLPTAAPAPAPAMTRAISLPTSVTSPPSQQTNAVPTAEGLFTNMGFTVAPASDQPQIQNQNSSQSQIQSQVQSQPPTSTAIPEAIDLTGDSEMGGLTLESFGLSSVPGAEIANMSLNLSNDDNVDARINELFDLDPTGTDSMELDYGLGVTGSSNFDELFFSQDMTQDDNGNSSEFNDAYFGL